MNDDLNEAELLAEDANAHPEDVLREGWLFGSGGWVSNRTPRQLRLARATVRRYEAGKLRSPSGLYHYQKACALLLSYALSRD